MMLRGQCHFPVRSNILTLIFNVSIVTCHCFLIAGVDDRVESLLSTALRPSTRRTYSSAQNRYLKFCQLFNIPPLPATELTLLRFISHISLTVSPNSIPVYLSAVRSLHVYHSFSPPPLTVPRVQLIIKSLNNLAPEVRQATPITFSLLCSLHKLLSPSWDDLVVWTCMCTLFFGVRRAGELVPSPEQINLGYPVPLVKDLHFVHHPVPAVLLRINRTKTSVHGINVILGCTGHNVCPLCAIITLLVKRGITVTTNVNLPLFQLLSGLPMNKSYFMARLRSLLINLGLDPKGFTPHSFRSGGATQLALNGVNEQLIQKAGQWSSLCYRRYIRESVHTLASYSKLFIPHNHT